MAHLAKLGALTEELVGVLTGLSSKDDPARFNYHRETALRSLRNSNYPRTNQFDVASNLEGLEEKFRVYNEDLLADALKQRLVELAKIETKWTPEVLHLLLELSDKPVTKSKLEHIDYLKEPEPDTGPTWTWKDVRAEDPLLRDKSVWKNVDFGAESSDEDNDEDLGDVRSEVSASTEPTDESGDGEEYTRRIEAHVLEEDVKLDFQASIKAQFWKKRPSVNGVELETVKKSITELQATREVLFMLAGNATSLFYLDTKGSPLIVPSHDYALKHVSDHAFQEIIQDFAAQGTAVMLLRSWVKQSQAIPLLQVLQDSISKRIRHLDAGLSIIQQRFVSSIGDVVVSLLNLQSEVRRPLQRLSRVSEMIEKLQQEPYSHAFRYLEILYDETCMSQVAGDQEMFKFLGNIFFECLQVYLRPMRQWMEHGELNRNDKVFFVTETAGEIELGSLWQSRFKIRKTQEGVLHAPRFLRATADKIFTTGKSVTVLKHLNRFASLESSRNAAEPTLDFQTVCDLSASQFAPFSELFDVAFDKWVQSKHHHASATLRATLFDSCGLHSSLNAISSIYYLADGIVASNFTNAIYDKLDTLDSSWNDRFTLTELAQSTLGSLPYISPEKLRTSVLPLPRKYQDVTQCRRSVKTLAVIELRYTLSWPIQIILNPATVTSYQKILTFLLQIRRSSHILTRQRLVKDLLYTTSNTDERALYYSLRYRLLWFTQTLYYYLTSVVIEPNSQAMHQQLRDAEDVDTMISVHSDYVKATLDQTLLGNKLKLIHKSILKILDQSIKLEDAQAATAAATKEVEDQQRQMMDVSIATWGLHATPKTSKPFPKRDEESSDEEELDIDLSILSSTYEEEAETSFVETLRQMRAEFDRLARFVASGLRGVARAGGGESSKNWDLLGEMLESGLDVGTTS